MADEEHGWGAGQRCTYCRRPMLASGLEEELSATWDHTIPKSAGGTEARPACLSCNRLKSDLAYGEWCLFMAEHPRWWETGARPIRPEQDYARALGKAERRAREERAMRGLYRPQAPTK